jgi:hypothetical protein
LTFFIRSAGIIALEKNYPVHEELRMRAYAFVLFLVVLVVTQAHSADKEWYAGDERCPVPKDDGKYSAPYKAQDHPGEYPTFSDADKQGWSCSYQREDGVIIQYGDSRTPQQQWLDVWGGGGDQND